MFLTAVAECECGNGLAARGWEEEDRQPRKTYKRWVSAGMELEESPETGANVGDSSPNAPIGTGGTRLRT